MNASDSRRVRLELAQIFTIGRENKENPVAYTPIVEAMAQAQTMRHVVKVSANIRRRTGLE
ncbi:hypothetical protein EHM76_01540 [bacterium]|nr:MAG: hypothetical protein EHM76_01540 [bacterium]